MHCELLQKGTMPSVIIFSTYLKLLLLLVFVCGNDHLKTHPRRPVSKPSRPQSHTVSPPTTQLPKPPHDTYFYEQAKRLPGRSPCYRDEESSNTICYPSYSIIGLMKSGTSSLHIYLQMHPLIKNIIRKELCSVQMEPIVINGKFSVKVTDNKEYISSITSDSIYPYLSVNNSIFGETCVGLAGVETPGKYAYEKYLPHSSLKILLIRSPLETLYSSYWYFCLPEELLGMRGGDVAEYCREYFRPDNILGHNLWENKNNYTFPRSPEDFHDRLLHPPTNETMNIFSQAPSIKQYDIYKYIQEIFEVYEKRNVMVIHSEELYRKTSEVLNNITSRLKLSRYNYSKAEKVTFNTYSPHSTYHGKGTDLAVPVKKKRATHAKMLPESFIYARPYLKDHCLLVEKLVPRTCLYWLQETEARPS